MRGGVVPQYASTETEKWRGRAQSRGADFQPAAPPQAPGFAGAGGGVWNIYLLPQTVLSRALLVPPNPPPALLVSSGASTQC